MVGGIIMVMLGVLLTYDVWVGIWRVSFQEQASYFMLVPFVAAWLAWVRRQRLRMCQPVGTWVGPVVVAIGWLLYSFGLRSGYPIIWEDGGLLIVIGCILSVFGTDVLVRFFPAFFSLVFLIPIPDALAPQIAEPIQIATADITQIVYSFFGHDLERQGHALMTHGTVVSLARTGSVLSVVMAFVLMAYAFAFGLPLRNSARVVIIAASPATALLCIVIRSLSTAWLYGNFAPQTVDTLLNFSGWVMIGAALLCLYGLVKLLNWASVPIRRLPLAYES